VSPSQLYPLDVTKALAGLTQLKSHSKVIFWSGGAEVMNDLGTGEIDYGLAFSNRIIQGRAAGLPLDDTYNQGLLAGTGAAIPKTAKNVDGAVALLDFYLQPKVQAQFAQDGALAPAYASANDQLDAATARLMATSAKNLPLTIPISNDWWAQNFTSANSAFTAWATK